MILHILSRAPHSGQAAAQALAAMAPDDRLILIEDAVFAIMDNQWQGWHVASGRIHVLEEDAVSRGLAFTSRVDKRALTSLDAFVSLTEKAGKVISWY